MMHVLPLSALFLTTCIAAATPSATGANDRWVGTWAAAPAWADSAQSFSDVTLREVVHTSIGGGIVRVRLSNAFGVASLTIADASMAVRAAGAAASGKPLQLTFGGERGIVIPAGAAALSDALPLRVAAASDVAVSLYVPGPTGPPTQHPLALQTSYIASGDRVDDADGAAFAKRITSWYFVSGLDVAQTSAAGAVVALGDSITDGWHSRIDQNGRWPDVLAERLRRLPPAERLGVLNEGISGARILLDGGPFGQNALARFDRDVLAQAGIRDVIVLLGINDMQQKPPERDARALAAGLRQLAVRAHEHAIRVFACTVLPAEGDYAYSPSVETTREAFNTFIRTTDAFDGVFDFDRVIRDPNDPHRMLPAYDSGDHLHPSPAGLRAMGDAVDISKLVK